MPKTQPVHLTAEAVLAIHAEVIAAHGGGEGISDRALLESAVAAPQASLAGEPLIANTVELGAAYLFYLCRNRPFVDGNKRTALAACLVFLQINGALPDPSLPARELDAWEALVMDVAGSREDRAGLTKRLKTLLRRRR